MILILNNANFVIAYNSIRPKESVDNVKNEVWYEGEFSFSMGEDIEGKIKRFKYVDGEIEIMYFDAPSEPVAPVPTQLDRIENNLALLTEDTAEYKAFYEAAKEILPEGSDA